MLFYGKFMVFIHKYLILKKRHDNKHVMSLHRKILLKPKLIKNHFITNLPQNDKKLQTINVRQDIERIKSEVDS